MTNLDISQAVASGEAKLVAQAYSSYLKNHYGLQDYCPCAPTNCLLLNLWAIGGWDNREGATNSYPQTGLNRLVKQLV